MRLRSVVLARPLYLVLLAVTLVLVHLLWSNARAGSALLAGHDPRVGYSDTPGGSDWGFGNVAEKVGKLADSVTGAGNAASRHRQSAAHKAASAWSSSRTGGSLYELAS